MTSQDTRGKRFMPLISENQDKRLASPEPMGSFVMLSMLVV